MGMNMSKFRGWIGALTFGVLVALLAGCGGGNGTAGPAGEQGTQGPQGPQGPSGQTGNSSGTTTAANFMSSSEWAAASFTAAVGRVTISSPPVVEFTLTDGQGKPVTGLEGFTATNGTTKVTTYPNLSFTLAKLLPRTDTTPSTWVSYIVTAAPFMGADGKTLCSNYAQRPNVENNGKLEAVNDADGKPIPGSYRYTFSRDVTKADTTVVERPTATNDNCYTASGGTPSYPNPDKTTLGNLAWQPDLPHRLVLQISGAARGTGSNTADGVTVATAVNLENPVNLVYDFVPSTGRVLTSADLTREDVNIASCNVCHGKLAFHGGSGRVETRYCVTCHTPQRAYGWPNVASTSGKFPALTERATTDASTGIKSYSYSPSTYVADSEVSGNFTTMIHKIHNGRELVKENYNYANLVFDLKGFSKLGGGQRMCTTCHDSKIAATADNHKKLPSRTSCGACHDGIVWATGGGSTLGDKAAVVLATDVLKTSGHAGGAQLDDSKCATCHTSAYIQYDHRMENLTKNNPAVLPGLASFRYEIASAAVDSTSNDVTIKFRVLKATAPAATAPQFLSTPAESDYQSVMFLPAALNMANPLAGFTGSPSFLLAYAKTQDGITSPSDFNNLGIKQGQPISVSIAALLNTSTSTSGANQTTVGSLAGPDSSGYYTATIRGNGSAVCGSPTSVKCVFPTGTKMRTVALQGYFTQIGAPTDKNGATGNVARHAISVIKTVTGDTARRTVVDAAKCASCHEWFEGHGGNRVYETQVCVMCHNTANATSGRGVADSFLKTFNFSIEQSKILKDWNFDPTATNAALKFPVTSNNFKDMIHGIHSGRERASTFMDARDSTSRGTIDLVDVRRLDFPGIRSRCETCHVTATGATTTYNAVPAGALVSTHESIDAAYAAGIAGATATPAMAKTALNTANATDKVTTPFAAACVSCHDSSPAKAHIDIQGAFVLTDRSVAQKASRPLEDIESCAVCHGPGRDFDTAKVHR